MMTNKVVPAGIGGETMHAEIELYRDEDTMVFGSFKCPKTGCHYRRFVTFSEKIVRRTLERDIAKHYHEEHGINVEREDIDLQVVNQMAVDQEERDTFDVGIEHHPNGSHPSNGLGIFRCPRGGCTYTRHVNGDEDAVKTRLRKDIHSHYLNVHDLMLTVDDIVIEINNKSDKIDDGGARGMISTRP